ncbi:MAG: hypothetical protein HRU09_06350 [Oligoflexales bacterium]|nr:hypothetical protein [Oligoflexales bacterium]
MSFFERTYWVGVGPKQTRTQVLSLLPRASKVQKLLVFIPGNPGIIHFYKPFLYDLLGLLNGDVGVLGISQAGHCGGKTLGNAGLEAQVDHKVQFFDLLAKHPLIFGLHPESVKEMIIMSHSLGSYLGLKSLARFPNLPITRFIGLFPTIQHLRHGIPLAIRLSARPVLRQGLASLVHVMPKQAREAILTWYCGQSEEAKYLLGEGVHQYRLVNNVLALAWDEIKDIRQIDDECHQTLNIHSEKISFVFGHKDPYVPLRFYQQMQEAYPDIDFELAPEEVPHDFVFDHNKTVAEQVAGKLSL